jgi:hypothetical protein
MSDDAPPPWARDMERRIIAAIQAIAGQAPTEPVTAERARDLALSLKAMADRLADAGDVGGARNMQRQAERWFAYAASAASKPPGGAQP